MCNYVTLWLDYIFNHWTVEDVKEEKKNCCNSYHASLLICLDLLSYIALQFHRSRVPRNQFHRKRGNGWLDLLQSLSTHLLPGGGSRPAGVFGSNKRWHHLQSVHSIIINLLCTNILRGFNFICFFHQTSYLILSLTVTSILADWKTHLCCWSLWSRSSGCHALLMSVDGSDVDRLFHIGFTARAALRIQSDLQFRHAVFMIRTWTSHLNLSFLFIFMSSWIDLVSLNSMPITCIVFNISALDHASLHKNQFRIR